MRIGLAADNGRWHKGRLRRALESFGVEPVLFSLDDVAVVTGGGEPLRVPGFPDDLPDGVLLRTIAGGTFEATTMRLGVLHALVSAGVTVWNAPTAIERSVDKAATSLIVARAGLPTPDTFVVSKRAAAADLVAREARPGRPIVLKPLFGSQGEGLMLIERPEDLPSEDAVNRVYYLQRYVPRRDGLWRDYRVFVCEGRAIAGMIREGDGWITNVHRGGRPFAWDMPEKAAALAEAAAAAIGVDYTGIDLVEDGEGGFLVLEVNSMPAWSGLQKVAETDIAACIVRGFLNAVRVARPLRALFDEVAAGSSQESAAKQKPRAATDCNAIGCGSRLVAAQA